LQQKFYNMSLILSIETSTPVCTVSLSENGKTIAIRESFDEKSHATHLTVFVEELLKENNITAKNLSAVAVSRGPGSYTGLRIGVSVAKGICYAAQIPLIAIDTLKTMAIMAANKYNHKNVLYCPMIDARRMEVYSELFDGNFNVKREVIAEVIDHNSYSDILAQQKIVFIGNGSEKLTNTITSPNAVFIEGIYPSANYMSELAYNEFQNKQFVDVAYFEPFYLKDFVATTPKKKVILN